MKENKREKNIFKIISSDKNILTREVLAETIRIKNSDKNILKKENKSKFLNKKVLDKVIVKLDNSKNQFLNVDIKEEKISSDDKFWAVISYIFAPLVYIFKNKSKYVLEHARRGMYLFYFEVSYIFLYISCRNLIKTNTSCSNFIHYNFVDGCKATPWWIDFIWGIIALGIVFVIVKCIMRVLSDESIDKEEVKKDYLY